MLMYLFTNVNCQDDVNYLTETDDTTWNNFLRDQNNWSIYKPELHLIY